MIFCLQIVSGLTTFVASPLFNPAQLTICRLFGGRDYATVTTMFPNFWPVSANR